MAYGIQLKDLVNKTWRSWRGDVVGNALVRTAVDGTQVSTDQTASWAASAVVNTHKIIDFTQPDYPAGKYALIISNESSVTDLNVEIYNKETSLHSETRRSLHTSVIIPKSTATVIESCEDAWNEQVVANVTSDVDAVNKVVGTNSADLIIAADAAVGILASEVISSTNLSPYTHIRLWVLSTVDLAAGDLQLLLDNTASCASPLETLNIPAITANTGTWVWLQLANPATDLAIISVGVKMVVDKGAFTLNIDDVNAVDLSTQTKVLENIFAGTDLELVLDNSTVLSTNDAFTAYVRLREV